ncbi:hypothetical protein KIPE111705_17600 [Kibdelosporangium persicum]
MTASLVVVLAASSAAANWLSVSRNVKEALPSWSSFSTATSAAGPDHASVNRSRIDFTVPCISSDAARRLPNRSTSPSIGPKSMPPRSSIIRSSSGFHGRADHPRAPILLAGWPFQRW